MLRARLTRPVIVKLRDAVAGGNYLSVAAKFAGVSDSVVYKWMAIGRELLADLEAQVGAIDAVASAYEKVQKGQSDDTLAHVRKIGESHPHWLCVELVDALTKAKAEAQMKAVQLITKAGQRNWQAAAWYLERTDAANWGRKTQVNVGGVPDSPVQLQVGGGLDARLKLLTDEQLDELAKVVGILLGSAGGERTESGGPAGTGQATS